jgi:nicotinamidase-related amidase
METALLLIDIQNDYFTGGRNPLVNAEQAADQAKRVLAYFCNKNLPVFHIQHISLQDGAAFFLQDTDGCTTKDLVWNDETIQADIVHKTFMASLSGTFATVMKKCQLEV